MNLLFKICIVLLVGTIGGKVAHLLKLPNVSGYLVAGLFLGPSFFHYISEKPNRMIKEVVLMSDYELLAIVIMIITLVTCNDKRK